MNVIGTIAVVVITSLYYFPFNCSLFPSVNTKLILASIGLLLFAFNSSMRRNAEVGDTFAKVKGNVTSKTDGQPVIGAISTT